MSSDSKKRTIAQTPSPKSDRIYGSDKNKVGSASSEGSLIKLSDKTINALKDKLEKFKESNPDVKNITLLDLEKVYRRGSGAYSRSHRPTITGGVPNSRAAWSFARVNKFLEKAAGHKVKAAYVQDDDLLKFSDGGELSNYNKRVSENLLYMETNANLGRGGRIIFGGNSGYEGYSMSKRAVQAYEDGKLTYSKLPTWAKRMVDAGIASTKEWHHTSSYGNKTFFYDVQNFLDELTEVQKEKFKVEEIESFKDVPKELIKELDEISKQILKNKNNIKEIRKLYIDEANKKIDEFNSKFKTYSRETSIPKYGLNTYSEMYGKYGWFPSTSRYSLPEYYTGIDYETEENYNKALQLKKDLYRAEILPIYEIQLQKKGLTKNEIDILKNNGIINSEIISESFYSIFDNNKDIIKNQIKELMTLPNPNNLDNYLTDEEKKARDKKHDNISNLGDDFGSSYMRRIAHEENDRNYILIAQERMFNKKQEFWNSDEGKKQQIKFNEDKEKSANIIANLNLLFEIDNNKNTNINKYAVGGEIQSENKNFKNMISHKSGSAGGMLVGNRHSEGGIKAINKSTNTPLEMEGGEVVITRDAVSDKEKREFEGEMLTNREILSRINESGGGVSFEKGGDIHKCSCSGKSYKYGGETKTDYEIVEILNKNYQNDPSMVGIHYPHKKVSEVIEKMYVPNEQYENNIYLYGEGGMIRLVHKKVPSFKSYENKHKDEINAVAMKKHYKQYLKSEYNIEFNNLPQSVQVGLLIGNQQLVDKYLNK